MFFAAVRCVEYCVRASCEVECNGAIAAATSGTRNARYAKKAHHIVTYYWIHISFI